MKPILKQLEIDNLGIFKAHLKYSEELHINATFGGGESKCLSFEIHSTLYFSMIINLTSTKSSYNGSSKKTISRIYFKFFTLRSYSNKHSCTKDRVTRFECSPLQKNGRTKTSVQDRFFKKSLIAMLAFCRLEEVVVNTAN